MKVATILAVAPALLFCSTPVSAQSQPETVAACLHAITVGDVGAVDRLSETILTWKRKTLEELRVDAALCVSADRGDPWAFDNTAGQFRPLTSFDPDREQKYKAQLAASAKQKAEAEQNRIADAAKAKAAEEELALQMAGLRKRQRELANIQANKDGKVLLGVSAACRNLWAQSKDAAFLNPLCVESFMRDGLPED